MNWDEALEKLEFQVSNRARKTQQNYIHYATEFRSYSDKALSRITPEDCQAYCNEAIAPSSQNVRAAALKFFFRYAVGKPITIDVIPRGTHAVTKALKAHEVNKAIRETPHPFKAAVYLIYGCGLKTNEVQKLKLTDLNQEYVKVKGRKVAMTKKHWPYIKWAMDQSKGPYLFCDHYKRKKPKHITTLQRRIPVTCCQLRDYFALKMVEQGATLVELCDTLGLLQLSSGVRYFEHVKRQKDRSYLTSPID